MMDRTNFPAARAAPELERVGTKDGRGAADHDKPYVFGRRPSAAAPFPFTHVQLGRLLILRGRVWDAAFAHNQRAS